MSAIWVCRWDYEYGFWRQRGFLLTCEECGINQVKPSWQELHWCDSHKPDWMRRAELISPAHRAVAKAIRKGLLPHPSTLKCEDCDKQAECYDHRDYDKPLEVAAVCRGCNSRRGPAKQKQFIKRRWKSERFQRSAA